jgi:DNA-3-methyladenine glycosylase I
MSAAPLGLIAAGHGRHRCAWCGDDLLYVQYHDEEWGRPALEDWQLFEKLCLEGFQSGLSWLTILRKREAFREAFDGFDPERVARYTAKDVARLLRNAGIVRHRGKIESTINNARRYLDLVSEYGTLAAYAWSWEPPAEERPTRITWAVLRQMPHTPTSTALSKDLKKRGWTFVGPTTVYAFMQAMGLVNDHVEGCFARPAVHTARKKVGKVAGAARVTSARR